MIVGNGMLAKEFSAFEQNDNIIIFASGVSNSQERDSTAFERELALLYKQKYPSKKLIYFSSISIYDSELTFTEYIKHKLKIEDIISKEFSKYIIFRLPQLVGKTDNPNTLCNFLYNKIIADEIITVFENACRYLMDVNDVVKLLSPMINSGHFDNSIIDVNFNNKITINELLDIFEIAVKKKTSRLGVSKGGCYNTVNDKFISQIASYIDLNLKDYNFHVVKKYYGSHNQENTTNVI